MRHPPSSQLTHHGRFARHRELFRPPAINADAKTFARGKGKINKIQFEPLSGSMIL
jgi:hypothetical protein